MMTMCLLLCGNFINDSVFKIDVVSVFFNICVIWGGVGCQGGHLGFVVIYFSDCYV